MTLEQMLLLFCGLVILFLIVLVFVMYVRIRQLIRDVETMKSRLMVTDSEIEALIRNVEEIRNLKI